ncbi:N(6)-hydroxylysine O-acetyltransferase [Streptomyces sp. RB5]|uniref:Lysine N-acyltransferase MbtK n=1 Tax=Streptomyces smaragdinus TaxID=2585196 RepID=A0A7K0CPW2_9ACTN|nr:N(6)-hydroxylysine O-acetyltransferase [Streptomyces smaragdinus]
MTDDTLVLRLPFPHPAGNRKPADTPAGHFRLDPVRPARDLPLLHRWMNDPRVNAYWGLAGAPARVTAHLRDRYAAGCIPCLGLLDGRPMSYWEIYRADLDPLSAHYEARPYDMGLHLLIGSPADRGRGLGSLLLRVVTGLVLDARPHCERVVAEPDIRNAPCVGALLDAGFRHHGELTLPDKRAALMVRERGPGSR